MRKPNLRGCRLDVVDVSQLTPVPLLDALPDLSAGLSARRAAAARAALQTEAEWVTPGPFARGAYADRGVVVLLLSGIVARTMTLEGVSAAELLGPGDSLAPPRPGRQDDIGLAGYHVRLEALETCRVGLLGPELAAALGDFPEVAGALVARRGAGDADRAAMRVIAQLTGVDRRLVALFRLLAARHGRATQDGIAVPVAVTHRLLAELVGARRQTVTTALRALERSGELCRLKDGSWLLRSGRAG